MLTIYGYVNGFIKIIQVHSKNAAKIFCEHSLWNNRPKAVNIRFEIIAQKQSSRGIVSVAQAPFAFYSICLRFMQLLSIYSYVNAFNECILQALSKNGVNIFWEHFERALSGDIGELSNNSSKIICEYIVDNKRPISTQQSKCIFGTNAILIF